MNITFDPVKDQTNTEKHGVSLAAAVEFEWDDALTWADERKAYGEGRMCAIGYIGNRLHYVVFVDRGEARRVISLRKANSREEKRYAEA
ncbi:MAG: BrnT family toxin [Gammaproteobacteria bacterium]